LNQPKENPVSSVTVKDLDNLVAEMAKKKAEIEALEEQTTEKNKELAAMQAKAYNYLRELGREDFKSPSGSLSIRQSWSITLPKTPEDKAALFDWMKSKGIYDAYASVHATALKSLFMAERETYIKEGGDPMIFSLPGLTPAKLFETANFTKSRK
jgi:hypothetical protein